MDSQTQLEKESKLLYASNKHVTNVESEVLKFSRRKYLRHNTPGAMGDLKIKQILGKTLNDLNKQTFKE